MSFNLQGHDPATLDEANDVIMNGMLAEERVYVRSDGTDILHHTLGWFIRNG